jgi:hypothetical protein
VAEFYSTSVALPTEGCGDEPRVHVPNLEYLIKPFIVAPGQKAQYAEVHDVDPQQQKGQKIHPTKFRPLGLVTIQASLIDSTTRMPVTKLTKYRTGYMQGNESIDGTVGKFSLQETSAEYRERKEGPRRTFQLFCEDSNGYVKISQPFEVVAHQRKLHFQIRFARDYRKVMKKFVDNFNSSLQKGNHTFCPS